MRLFIPRGSRGREGRGPRGELKSYDPFLPPPVLSSFNEVTIRSIIDAMGPYEGSYDASRAIPSA